MASCMSKTNKTLYFTSIEYMLSTALQSKKAVAVTKEVHSYCILAWYGTERRRDYYDQMMTVTSAHISL